MSPELKRLASFASLVVPIVTAMGASAMLLVDYLRPVGFFCDDAGGCGVVKQSAFSHVFGVPLPGIGLSAFAILGVLALRDGPRARRVLAVLAAVGGAVGLALIATQFVIGAFCTFCLVVDTAAVVAAAAAIARFVLGLDPPFGWRALGPAAAAMAVAAIAPLAIAGKAPKVPEPIARELSRTPPGVVTVIDFADFECPFCRETHAKLEPLLTARSGKVRVVRKHVPLPTRHPHAMDAARAACCAELQGRGDQMANALFSAPTAELTPEGCARLAVQVGLDPERFRTCIADPSTDARIEADRAVFRDTQGVGLPTLWIGEQKIEGAVGGDILEQALDQAIARARS